MRNFKLLLVAIILSMAWVVVGVIRLSADKTSDAGLEIFNYILAGVILSGIGLLIDLFLVFARSTKNSKTPFLRNRMIFWQIISGLVALGVLYIVYVLVVS